ncbi:hypothetical protein HV346_10450 [Enterobacter sp. RHBSTW-00994]|nr:hypothetical protein HV346_10450 [Enterobacter sp. RHBSTW-00994]
MLTSLTDPNRYPGNDISELYRHRRETELGYRAARQSMLDSRWTLRSRLPELVRQELWGVLLAYKLVRYQMVQMVFHLKGDDLPNQLSFSGAISEIIRLAKWLILPGRRERSYPRELRVKTRKYPDKKVAGHLK